jgi:hypothetical protein
MQTMTSILTVGSFFEHFIIIIKVEIQAILSDWPNVALPATR